MIPGRLVISQNRVSLKQTNDGMFYCFFNFTTSKQTPWKAICGQPCTTITVKATTQTTLMMKSVTYLFCVYRVETKTISCAVLDKTFCIILTQYSIISWHAKIIQCRLDIKGKHFKIKIHQLTTNTNTLI